MCIRDRSTWGLLKPLFGIKMEGKKIDRKRIVTKDISEAILCKICLEVLDDPVECSECNSDYCRDCIKIWRARNPTCPNRCASNILQKPHKLVFSMLNALEISCKYTCLLYTSPSPRDLSTSRMPSSA
eukprot:TRINITY_DN5677_c0_g1_i1.p3 TRINITY_DN5677_c0_g1~~TRINITY_DN5677_c0_g1_i1.p3  ORF type:complete len:128 (+),score=52.91 TRINITY_DN5677_c0_g1_i1:64-447(+)